MKKGILALLTFTTAAVLITSCGGGGEGGPQRKVYNYEKADSLSVDYLKELGSVKVNIEMAAKLFISLKERDYTFDASLMTPTSKSFATSKQQALGLGMFSASLSYAAVYEQSQPTTDYITSIMGLANKLGIQDAFNEELLKKITSTDTTVNKSILLTKAFINATDQLYSEDRAKLVCLMVSGGFIEGLKISTAATRERFAGGEIGFGIYEQVLSYENTMKMLKVFKEQDQDVKTVYEAFKSQEAPIMEAINSHGKLNQDHIVKLNAAITQLESKLV